METINSILENTKNIMENMEFYRKRSWFLGLFVESYNVTFYWLKESILKNWLLGFLPHKDFPRYILCYVIVYLSMILLHVIANEC
jgi:hypothetical protein